MLRELPEPMISSADRRAAVFRRGHDVDILEARFADDPLVRDTIQSDAAGITEILADAQLAKVLDEVKQRVFQRRLAGCGESFIFARPVRPPFVETKPPRHCVFEVKLPVRDIEKLPRGKLCLTIRCKGHYFAGFRDFAEDLLSR